MSSSTETPANTAGYHGQIIDSLSSGVIAVDRDGHIITANPAACAYLDLAPEALPPGIPFERVLGTEQFGAIIAEIQLSRQPISRREVALDTPDGRKVIGVSASPLQGPGDYNGVIFLFVDLTEVQALKRAAELNRQLAQIGELTAGVVHELRNPLSVISGMSELLVRKLGEGHEHQQKARAIFEEAAQLERLISQFLSFARPYEVEPVRCATDDILDRALRLCERLAAERRVRLEARAPEDAPVCFADQSKVALALSNIIRNAIEAVRPGGEVQVSIAQEDDSVVYAIEDNGPGIHLEEGEDLFTAFLTKKEGGTGLGLAIVHRVITAHGGSVSYGNRPGGGAYFRVRLPLEKTPA